ARRPRLSRDGVLGATVRRAGLAPALRGSGSERHGRRPVEAGMTVAQRPMVAIGEGPLRIEDVVAVADGALVELAADARERILAGRGVVEDLVNGETLIYGLNTGLGHSRNQRMPIETLREYQIGIVIAHAGAIGPPLPTRLV